MPIYKIQHTTKYAYDGPVKESVNEIKVYPYHTNNQEVLYHELLITGNPDVQAYTDYWGNRTGVFNLLPPHDTLIIESRMLVRTIAPPELALNVETGFAELAHTTEEQLQLLELSSTDAISSHEAIRQMAATVLNDTSVAATVANCCRYIYENFLYIKGITNVETTVDEIIEHKSGVCQDFAHLMLQVLRSLKIPSRYVSGYICPNKNGMRGEGATHAWVEAWIPEYGWAGIDPTNNVWVTNTHVKLAAGRHFNDCSPVKGTFKGSANQNLSVHVSIGYEDGQTFEELNNVRLRTFGPVQEAIVLPVTAVQQ